MVNVSEIIETLERADFTAEDIVTVLYHSGNVADMVDALMEMKAEPDVIGVVVSHVVQAPASRVRHAGSRRQFKSGAKDRHGYDGPVTPMLPEKEWLPLRAAILRRDAYVCKYCGVEGQHNAKWTVDHVVPLSRGGTHDYSNLVACCIPCNSSKNDRLLSEWKGRYQ